MNMLEEWIYLNTEGSQHVVDFGAGFFDKLHFVHPTVVSTIGIEAHAPYAAKAHAPEKCVKILGDMRDFESLLTPSVLDTAMFIDTLEHLSMEDAADLIFRVQAHFQKILLFVPEGSHPQTKDIYNMGGDSLQTHRSTWYTKDVENLGFQKVVVAHGYHKEPGKDSGAIFAVWTNPAG